MKKMFALVLALVVLFGAVAVADEKIMYAVSAYNYEEDFSFVEMVDIEELGDIVSGEHDIMYCYAMTEKEMVSISWEWSDDSFIFYVFDSNGIMIDSFDYLPQIH